MAYSANGYEFTGKSLSRVKYDLEYDSDNDLYRFKGKAPELIQIQLDAGATNIFFDSLNDYEPEWFEISTLNYVYGGQIFTDVANERNMIWVNEEVTGDCLDSVNNFIKNPA